MGALMAPLAWFAGVAAAGAAYFLLVGTRAGLSLGRTLGEALVAGWVLCGALLMLLTVMGAALGPAACLAPAAVLLALALLRPPATFRWGLSLRRRRIAWPAALAGLAVLARLAWHLARWPWGQPWSWDVYAVWGFKARYLVSTGGLWRYLGQDGLYPFSHPDYPLLLPSHLAAVSWPSGAGAYAALPDAVLAAGVLLIWYELWKQRLGALSAVGLTLLLSWPGSLWAAHLVGLADRPLALLAGLTAALALVGSFPRDLPLAAVALGGMALLKNEGLPLALLLGAALVVIQQRRRVAAMCGLAVLPGVAWLVGMMLLGHRSDRLAGAATFARAVKALAQVGNGLLAWVAAPDLVVVAAAGAVAAAILLAAPRRRWVALALIADAALLTLAVVLGPYDLSWQIHTALPRLGTQLVPALVACVGAALVWLAGGERRRTAPGRTSLPSGAEDADAAGGIRGDAAHHRDGPA